MDTVSQSKKEGCTHMEQKNNIFIKLELTKESSSKNLTLTIHINPHAPNIINHDDHISWIFTEEEQDLLYDAIALIRNKQLTTSPPTQQKTIISPFPTQTTDDAINETIEKHTRTQPYTPNTQETIDSIIKAKNNHP